MIGFATWIATGLVVGICGKLALPGPALGWPAALGLGAGGGLLGGLVATWMRLGGTAELDFRAMILAALSAALIVLLTQLSRSLSERPRD